MKHDSSYRCLNSPYERKSLDTVTRVLHGVIIDYCGTNSLGKVEVT